MKFIYLLSTLTTILFLSSCVEEKKNEPEQIGRNTFEILKNISIKSKQQYIEHFPSVEDIRELAKNETLVTDQKTRNEMTSMPKEEWIELILKDYNQTKEKAATLGINWQEITYLDYVYEIEEKKGLKGVKGKLYFKSNEKSYHIEVNSIWNGTEYMIIRIKDLSE